MQKLVFAFVVFATISMSSIAVAQRPGGGDGAQRGGQRGGMRGGGGQRGGYGRGGERPVSPLMAALDADKDGKLSAEEIKNAVAALKTLDKNEDGILEATELTPPRSERGNRGGGGGMGGFDPSAMVDRIMERDGDKDGKLTKEEAGERMAGAFERVDTDKDGFLTREEIVEMTKQWGGGGRGGRGGGGGRGQQPKSKENRPSFDDN